MSRAEPFFFGPDDRPRAGLLHRAEGAAETTDGVVLCNPFGYEAICAHRSLRRFAEAFAEAGIAALRFDYDGTGDSAGADTDPARLEGWVQSTRDACRALREHAGVTRVWILGVRLGALVGALAAEGLELAGFVAIAPVVNGRAYLRELKMLQTALGLEERAGAVPEGGQEALGFAITPETRRAVEAVRLTKLRPPADRVLVLDREDLPSAEEWTRTLAEGGASVTSERVRGYVEMVLDPHKVVVPEPMVARAVAFVAASAERRTTTTTSPRPRTRAEVGEVVEEPVSTDGLFGILATPRSAAPSGRSIVLLNAGAVHHVGPNRLYVALARRLAAAGDEVLRVDVTGIGESPARPGEPENVVYSDRALEDVAAVVRFLRGRGARTVWCVGLCSGAYHALKAAVANEGISGYVAINPLTFRWTPDTPLDAPAFRVVGDAARYRRSLGDAEKWKKLLRGEVKVRVALATVARRVGALAVDRARDASRRLGVPWKHDLGAELESLAARSVVQRFVFASSDPGQELLRDKGGSAFRTLRARGLLAVDVIDGPDHTFTPLWSHEPFLDVLARALA